MTIKKLQEQNERIRTELKVLINLIHLDKDKLRVWKLIHKLIDNEIEQEELCGQ